MNLLAKMNRKRMPGCVLCTQQGSMRFCVLLAEKKKEPKDSFFFGAPNRT